MNISKRVLLMGSLIFSIILVYGLAIIVRLFTGSFFFGNGVADIGYVYLTLGIALPCILYSLLAQGNIIKVLIGTLFFVSLLFIPVYLVYAFENNSASTTFPVEYIFSLIYFLLTIILIGISHFELNRSN